MKKIFCCPALDLFHCLPLWKTVLFVSSSEATWKKATKSTNDFPLGLSKGWVIPEVASFKEEGLVIPER